MRRHRFFSSAAIVAWLAMAPVLSASSANATVLYDNTSSAATNGDPIVQSLYDSFSTGSQGLFLSSVTVLLYGVANTIADGGLISALLYDDSSGMPNLPKANFGTISDSSITSTNGAAPTAITLTTSVPFALAPNARYWVGLADGGGTNATSALWAYDGGPGGVGVATEFYYNTFNGSPFPNSGGAYLMQVSAVPEPTSMGLLLTGLSGVILAGYARRKAL